MAKELLSDAKVRAAKARKKRYSLSDGGGLVIFINPGGKKSWHYTYCEKGRTYYECIGEYPLFSLSEGREIVKNRKRARLEGKIYGNETFKQAAIIWFDSWAAALKPASTTQLSVLSRLRLHMYPALEKKRLSEITKQDVMNILLSLKAQGLNATARNVLIDLKRIFMNAIDRGACEKSPAQTITAKEKLGSYTKGARPALTDPKKVAQLVHHIDTLPSSLEKYALQLMMIFATRTKELLLARWEDIDFSAKLWRIPAETMKGRKIHIVPLPHQAITLLKALKEEIKADEWVFFKNGKYNRNLLLNPLYRLGYKGKMSGHGFRATFETLLKEFEKEKRSQLAPVIEKQLAHNVQSATVRAYDRTEYIDDRIVLMQVWADHIDAMRLLTAA